MARLTQEVLSKNLYKILELPYDASLPRIKASYRRLALLNHPDKSARPDATAIFQTISDAYSVLSDDSLRRQYDRLRGITGIKKRNSEDNVGSSWDAPENQPRTYQPESSAGPNPSFSSSAKTAAPAADYDKHAKTPSVKAPSVKAQSAKAPNLKKTKSFWNFASRKDNSADSQSAKEGPRLRKSKSFWSFIAPKETPCRPVHADPEFVRVDLNSPLPPSHSRLAKWKRNRDVKNWRYSMAEPFSERKKEYIARSASQFSKLAPITQRVTALRKLLQGVPDHWDLYELIVEIDGKYQGDINWWTDIFRCSGRHTPVQMIMAFAGKPAGINTLSREEIAFLRDRAIDIHTLEVAPIVRELEDDRYQFETDEFYT